MIRQFLSEVDWGESVDYLVLDTPPGTSDEHLSAATYLKSLPGLYAVILTTPQEVRRFRLYCRVLTNWDGSRLGLHYLGIRQKFVRKSLKMLSS